MALKSPSDPAAAAVKVDKERELRKAIIEDAPASDGADRDLVHGEGGTLGLPKKPSDLNHDD